MRSKKLVHKLTPLAEFNDLFLALIPIFIVSLVLHLALHSHKAENASLLITIPFFLFAIIFWLIYHYFEFKQRLEKHRTGLISLAKTNQWKLQTNISYEQLPQELNNASIFIVANRDAKLVTYLQTPSWNYIDLSYCIYRETKYGEYKAADVYCSVIVAKLPRILPNIFFDSKKQKDGQKYKSTFIKSQRHSLEGDFDNYFETYFAEGYTIDSMSFITPDVMLALENAADYDIEIIGDHLLMYGPVYVDTNKIAEDADKLKAIIKTLSVTAKSYDDTRLPGNVGFQTVSSQGLQLKRKSNIAWVAIIFIVVYAVVRALLSLHSS